MRGRTGSQEERMAEDDRQYWIVVGGPENFEAAKARGFDMFGFKSTRRREASKMRPGDKLIFYLTGQMKFAGVATVQSEMYEDHDKVFASKKKPGEDYPFRVKTEPDVILDPSAYLDVRELAPGMQYTKKWPAEHWRLAFQGNLHVIPREDYEMLAGEMKGATAAGQRSQKTPR
jgi:predicted RNA-binding protein